MKLLNVEAVLDRDKGIQRAGHKTEVMKELHDKTNSYAILSHRWGSDSEVSYEEMTGLMKMGKEDREEVRQRRGYQKIIKSCEQAKKDGYNWLWIDTCCIDKRSSAELTEAINSMYRWYRNSQICYVYLNDVNKSEFPTEQDFSLFSKSNGWPEWFSRGWTLQELIAPRNAEFFNKDWVSIGSKEGLMSTLTAITRIPKVVLSDEGILRNRVEISKRLRVAQIMSWAAERETTRVEDRAYSLLGLFDVNMPMLYGEGSKAFQRLQLEIIRVSSDHSIFAWNPKGRFGLHSSVLADHPGCFRGCHDIQEVYPNLFEKELERYIQWRGLQVATNWNKLTGLQRGAASTQLFRFDVANLGIQVSLPVIRVIPLPPRDDTNNPECYMALLPCYDRYGKLFTINLQSIEHSFHRYFRTVHVPEECPVFRSLYLEFSQYAEESYRELRFHDKRTSYYGFTRRGAFPCGIADDTATLSSQGNNLIVLVYANDKDRSRFAVGFGYYCNEVWAHIVCDKYPADQEAWSSWADFAKQVYNTMWNTPIGESHLPQYNSHSILNRGHLPRSTWDAIVIHFNRDRNIDITDIMIDIKPCPGCCTGPRECTYHLFPDELWLPPTWSSGDTHELELNGQSARFDQYLGRIALGDYGCSDKNNFKVFGNIFQDMQELDIDSMDPVYQPVVSLVSSSQRVPHRMRTQHDIVTCGIDCDSLVLRQPKGLLLPNNAEFNLLLRALSARIAQRDLVTAVIQCSAFYKVNNEPTQMDTSASVRKGGEQSMGPGAFTPLCIFHPSAPHGSPACVQRRENFKNIREHFYALANLPLSGTEPCDGSLRDRWAPNGLIDCLDMFGVESLKSYVGQIAFFKRLPSMMETQLRNEASVGRAGA
ncbi:heterokaryon incompatibility protein-domain-containing protein [Pisolithus croceorrhizus]|nr:heterokaryon incompatibility protein-domain-containing protein [Pisolithus croceorrhizus]